MSDAEGEFQILHVDPASVEGIEDMGSKPKVWFRHQGHRWLFKEARPGTAEHIAEKVAAEIARILGIKAAHVELAEREGRAGCACKSFIVDRNTEFLIHGNELLAGLVVGYDKSKIRKQSDHTLANIIGVIERVFREARDRERAASELAGYVLLDAVIANVDRHDENWGLLLEAPHLGQPAVAIAPSFDHASSLGRELTDATRSELLGQNRVLEYVKKGKGGIYIESGGGRGCSPLSLAIRLCQDHPSYIDPWRSRLPLLDESRLDGILKRFPTASISRITAEFMADLVLKTRSVLLTPPT